MWRELENPTIREVDNGQISGGEWEGINGRVKGNQRRFGEEKT